VAKYIVLFQSLWVNRRRGKISFTYVSDTTSITTRRSVPTEDDNEDNDMSKCVCEVKEKTRLLITAAFVSIILLCNAKGQNIF